MAPAFGLSHDEVRSILRPAGLRAEGVLADSDAALNVERWTVVRAWDGQRERTVCVFASGEVVPCDIDSRGRIVDEDGAPLARAEAYEWRR